MVQGRKKSLNYIRKGNVLPIAQPRSGVSLFLKELRVLVSEWY